jgi:hypothetical protein
MTVDLNRLIAALRDTAEKATSTETIERVGKRHGNYGIEENYSYPETSDRYSRDWIAGRLLGMADTLEAMLVTPSQNGEGAE